jgi:hypothetical protein
MAIREGVGVRPVLRRVTGRATRDSVLKPLDCGSTHDSMRPPCAARDRRLRMTQCTEGWRLAEEPERSDGPTRAGSQATTQERKMSDLPQQPAGPDRGAVFTAVRPDRCDYRRAAVDALHFSKLMDRWFENCAARPAPAAHSAA